MNKTVLKPFFSILEDDFFLIVPGSIFLYILEHSFRSSPLFPSSFLHFLFALAIYE